MNRRFFDAVDALMEEDGDCCCHFHHADPLPPRPAMWVDTVDMLPVVTVGIGYTDPVYDFPVFGP